MKRQSISVGRAWNSSALIRVPRTSHIESTRLELRCPDPSCNPYLAFTVMLEAGLDGIRRQLPPPDANEENLYLLENKRQTGLTVLPSSLEEAIRAMEEDELVRSALGAHIFDRFIQAKRLEWEDYRIEVTPWELNNYLPNY